MLQYGFDTTAAPRRSVVTIGSFDGVHQGHRALLEQLKAMAARMDAESVVVTFDPHPRIAMGRAEGMQLLTTIEERARLLKDVGIDRMVVAHFDDKFRSQPYESFVRDMLIERLGMVGMIVGYNHRLGRGSEGNYERLMPMAERCGFDIECVAQHKVDESKVSSTVVRDVLMTGDMARVKELLGGGYVVMGNAKDGVVVVSDPHKLLPPDGEYRVTINKKPATLRIENRRIIISERISGSVVIRF